MYLYIHARRKDDLRLRTKGSQDEDGKYKLRKSHEKVGWRQKETSGIVEKIEIHIYLIKGNYSDQSWQKKIQGTKFRDPNGNGSIRIDESLSLDKTQQSVWFLYIRSHILLKHKGLWQNYNRTEESYTLETSSLDQPNYTK